MTDLEILRTAINDLDKIQVPVSLTDTVAIPIFNVSLKLKQLHNAICKVLEQQNNEQTTEEVEPNETVEQSV